MNYSNSNKPLANLKSCPFCGCELVVSDDGADYIHPNNKCFLSFADSEYGNVWFPVHDMESREAWNRRADDENQINANG